MSESPRTVSDVMTQTVVAVGSEAPFKEVVELLDQWKVSALPVLAGEGRVIGVVSEADLLAKEEFRDVDEGEPGHRVKAGAITAGELMSSPAVTVHADAPLAEAARIMARRHVKRLPVVDGVGVLQGVVSRADLLKVFLRPDTEIAEDVRREVLEPVEAAAAVTVAVDEGVVTLGGSLSDRLLVPVIARAARAVEGVVDVRLEFAGR
ncbi:MULTISPECIES: CBS domain-containing protein [unclassified Streptomyces]|uniref:CBS domain-containing protein n=1 Tax=unclassified Streptomyces TaxID=2593676 RepID=UPI001F038C13|nr:MULTISPECIES: CBS domain-containing protein [unclassified Streptomyces]MCH0565785.1 CBS domain-containing protein [Streptomyces sp. MUM 2J]MCH0571040.1 CBS domain-containing protein [Streptomyces sp. MUM 136J]